MPQLDPTWFASQLFWLALCMVMLYVVLSRYILPPLLGVLEQRASAREDDLARAEAARSEAAVSLQDYEAAMADARLRAQSILAESEQKNESAHDQATQALNQTLAAKLNEADRKIATQRAGLMSQLEPAATELAMQAVTKLTGLNVEAQAARAAVQRAAQG